jgi:hypothetical protein
MHKPVTLLARECARRSTGRPEGQRGDGDGVAVITNIRHGLQLSRQFLGARDTPDRQALLITGGLPTAHFEGGWPGLLYPPDPRTEGATLREAQLCAREGITINVFLLASWCQTSGGRALRLQGGGIGRGMRLLHRRQPAGPLRRLALKPSGRRATAACDGTLRGLRRARPPPWAITSVTRPNGPERRL